MRGLRMGHGAWGMGHGAWGMGHGAWGMGLRSKFGFIPIKQLPITHYPFPITHYLLPNLKYAIPTLWKNEFTPLGAFLGDNALLGF
jgi:hypothetical protein